MLVVRIIGGLGNQMLQYSFGKFLSKKGYDVRYDISDFSKYSLSSYKLKDIFKIELPTVNEADLRKIKDNSTFFFSRLRRKFLGRNRQHIMQNDFELGDLDKNSIYYLDGYWHSLEYLRTVESEIKHEFSVAKSLSQNADNILSQIKESNSVSVHFRRGDYVKFRKNVQIYTECDHRYYYPAASCLVKKIPNPTFFAFSDDIQWVKKNFTGFNIKYVEDTVDYEDLTLMSSCKHNIIANSTFSWWGAFLNSNGAKLVIAPKNWFKDRSRSIEFIEESWRRL